MDAGKKMDMFKLGLVRSVDPHFTRQVMTVEVDFWWVGVPKISSAVAIDAKSKQAAGGEEDVEPFEEEPPPKKKTKKAHGLGGTAVLGHIDGRCGQEVGRVQPRHFPTLAALARGEFSGLAAEATSERTFSYSGRLFSKLRRRMSVANLCAMVVGAAFPWPISDAEIMTEYESRLDRRRATAAAAAAAAAVDAEDSD